MKTRFCLAALVCLTSLHAQEPPSAKDLAAKLADAVWDGSSTARLKMDFQPSAGGEKTVLQLKINARRTREGTGVHYQVLWPKDRKDESFVLRQPAGQPATGSVLQAAVKPITNIQDGIFGSDLAYEDLVGNYFAWDNQKITGAETIGRIPCQILESKPGKGDNSSYGSIRTWIDTKRMVPLKVEKFGPGGQLVRRITITLVTRDDTNRTVPANFTIERPGKAARTILEGSNIRHDVTLTDADFSPDVLRGASP